jgi:hypothetical protein
VRSSHNFSVGSAIFDDDNLVSSAGLVPVMELASQTGLRQSLSRHVRMGSARVVSGAANPAGKLEAIVAGMLCGADSFDDLELLRAGGVPTVFDGVYASSTLGIFLREFGYAHTQQLAAAARENLIALAHRTPVLEGIDEMAYLDIDSMLRPVYGHGKEGASFGHAKVAGRQVLRRGLSPLITTLCTQTSAPVVAEMRLRSGRTASGKNAASQIRPAIKTARACGATGKILVRGDSAYGNRNVIEAAVDGGVWFSLTLARNRRVDRAIASIPDHAWTPVHYPGAVVDPDTGELISDAEVAEIVYIMVCDRYEVTGRLVVRRVKDGNHLDALFPVWRHHPFFTNSDLPVVTADITHRRHAVIETLNSDVIDGPLAHLPSKVFAANYAWTVCAQIAHNLLRAAATLTTAAPLAPPAGLLPDDDRITAAAGDLRAARGATLRRKIINTPARFARPAGRPTLHLPSYWPWQQQWMNLWTNVIGHTLPPARAA